MATMAVANSPVRHSRYSPYSASPRLTPSNSAFASPATQSSSLPRGILRRRPPAPHNTPVTPNPSVSARWVRFSNLSPSRRPRVELTPDTLDRSETQTHNKVRGWLNQQWNHHSFLSPADDLLSSPLARLSLASRPSHPSPQAAQNDTKSNHGVHATFHPCPLARSGESEYPFHQPPSPPESDSSGGTPFFLVRPTSPDIGDMDWSTRSGGVHPFSHLIEYTSDLTTSPSENQLDHEDGKKQNEGFPWGVDMISERPERLPIKFGSPLPAGFPDSPEDSPFEELYRTISSSPSSSAPSR